MTREEFLTQLFDEKIPFEKENIKQWDLIKHRYKKGKQISLNKLEEVIKQSGYELVTTVKLKK